ncbi:MAG TPA: DUF1501 domain-containing protein [Pirellulales bacterium]|nr:DUF1501 domain-containing protein [Pirellulales bacterium]
MFRIHAGRTAAYCDGLSRRNFVQLGMAGMGSLGLSRLLEARSEAATVGKTPKDTAVILLWLDGGPSHLDLYDLKPDAPAEVRGIWDPITTNVPGVEISELFPKQARTADKFSIIRSLHHEQGDHFTAGHYMLTTRGGASGADTAGRYPGINAIASKLCGPRQAGLPAQVAIPHAMSIGLRPGYFGGNYLGQEFNPFETEGDPNAERFRVQNLHPQPAVSLDRLSDRRTLLTGFDRFRRDCDSTGVADSMNRFQREAYDLVTGPRAAQAFDLSRETPELRERYGRNAWGQSTLLARRLVEAGCTFVTVHCGGWDHHWDLQKGMERYLPQIDALVSTLFDDLTMRGLWERVLVVMCGEFSRTPKMNNGGNGGPPLSMGTPGRDHWGNAMFCLLGGGGVQGGRIVGSTTRAGDVPKDRPVTPADLHATIYHVLGIDPSVSFVNRAGRPVSAIDGGAVIQELF